MFYYHKGVPVYWSWRRRYVIFYQPKQPNRARAEYNSNNLPSLRELY